MMQREWFQNFLSSQAGAICLVAVAMSSLMDLDCWSSDTIDTVITSGNSLFIESSVGECILTTFNEANQKPFSLPISSQHERAEIIDAEHVTKLLWTSSGLED
jgi:hypothetical protein